MAGQSSGKHIPSARDECFVVQKMAVVNRMEWRGTIIIAETMRLIVNPIAEQTGWWALAFAARQPQARNMTSVVHFVFVLYIRPLISFTRLLHIPRRLTTRFARKGRSIYTTLLWRYPIRSHHLVRAIPIQPLEGPTANLASTGFRATEIAPAGFASPSSISLDFR